MDGMHTGGAAPQPERMTADGAGMPPPDVVSEAERLADMNPVACAAGLRQVAEALGIKRADLEAAVKAVRRERTAAAKASAAGEDAKPNGPASDTAPLSREEQDAELDRLAGLPPLDYQAERPAAAPRLGLGVMALDKAVKAARERQRAEREAAHRSQPPPGPGEVKDPFGFHRRQGVLYGDAGTDASPMWLAAPFDVLGETRDGTGSEWGLWLRWHDGDGRLHTWMLPAALLRQDPESVEAELARRGLRCTVDPAGRMMLRRYFAEVMAGSRVRIAYACGWQGGDAEAPYLLPDGTVLGEAAEPVVLHAPAADAAQRCGVAGSLAGWQGEVAALAVGNPLAAFCIAAAFAGPLLLPAGEPGGGFHLTGESKRGKTLAVQMGLSAWGLPYKAGALRDWRSTANGLEAAAEDAGDGLLTLDELHQANPAEVAGAAYMLADGSGKGRLKRDASAARRRKWLAFILSTGEHDVATHVAKAGQRLPAGAEVRLPSIPVADAGEVWPALHGRPDLGALWRDLHDAMKRHHGEAARAFIAHLAAERQRGDGGLVATLDTMRERMLAHLPPDADPQVRDVARRFALVAAAGELAAAWRILPWKPGEAERAARAMLSAWLARRPSGAGGAESAAQLERVRTAILAHGASRFATLLKDDEGRWYEQDTTRAVVNRLGWRKRDGGRDEYLIPQDLWRTEICAPAGLDPAATARTLAGAGFLRRGDGKNLARNEQVPGMGVIRVYVIPAALIEASGEVGAKAA